MLCLYENHFQNTAAIGRNQVLFCFARLSVELYIFEVTFSYFGEGRGKEEGGILKVLPLQNANSLENW